jgi:hypothetical protein
MENNSNITLLVLGVFREKNSKKIIGCFNLSQSVDILRQNLNRCISDVNPSSTEHELCLVVTNDIQDISVENVERNFIQFLDNHELKNKYCLATWQ